MQILYKEVITFPAHRQDKATQRSNLSGRWVEKAV